MTRIMHMPTVTARADNGRGASENNVDGQDDITFYSVVSNNTPVHRDTSAFALRTYF